MAANPIPIDCNKPKLVFIRETLLSLVGRLLEVLERAEDHVRDNLWL
jgi:hypothetical protein